MKMQIHRKPELCCTNTHLLARYDTIR